MIAVPLAETALEDFRKLLDGNLGAKLDVDALKHELEHSFQGLRSALGTQRSRVRVVDGAFDITIWTENGETRVTVFKSGEEVAIDLSHERVGELPQDVRERIETIERGFERARCNASPWRTNSRRHSDRRVIVPPFVNSSQTFV